MFLLGAAASLCAAGLYLAFSNMFAVPYARQIRTTHLLPIAIASCTSLGVFAPRLMNRRLSRIPGGGWTHVGLLGLACGVVTAVFPVILTIVHMLCIWIHSQFLLSDLPLRMLQFGVMMTICLPFAGLGLTALLLTKTLSRAGPTLVRDLLILVAGLIAGSTLASLLQARPGAMLPAASLPLLIFAIIAGSLSNSALCDVAGPAVQPHPAEDR